MSTEIFRSMFPLGVRFPRGSMLCDFRNTQAIGVVPGTRLVWQALKDGRLHVRVKNKSLLDLKGMLIPQRESK